MQVVTAHALGRTIILIPAGLLLDRYGAKTAMLAGSALVLCGAFVTAVTPFFGLLFLGQFFAGVGDSVWTMGREVSGVEMVEPQQRGRLLSGFMGVKSAGMAIGPVAGGIIAQWVGFRMVFVVYTAAALVVFVTSVLARKEAVRGHVGKIAWWGKISDVLPDLRATFVMLVFATFSMQMYRTTLQGMLPLYAGVELGFSAAQVGSLFGVSGLFVLLMILPAGFITDRVGRKYASVPSTALPGIAFLALPFASTLPQLVMIMILIRSRPGHVPRRPGGVHLRRDTGLGARAASRTPPDRGRVRRGHGPAAGRLARRSGQRRQDVPLLCADSARRGRGAGVGGEGDAGAEVRARATTSLKTV